MQEQAVMRILSLRSCNGTLVIERNCHTCISNRKTFLLHREYNIKTPNLLRDEQFVNAGQCYPIHTEWSFT